MIVNYLKLAYRRFIRNPFFTITNIIGLSVGFTVFFVLWQYSRSELRSDQFHKDYKNIARFCTNMIWTDDTKNWEQNKTSLSSTAFSEELSKEYNEITDLCRVLDIRAYNPDGKPILKHGKKIYFSYVKNGQKKVFKEEKVVYADTNFFMFFNWPLIYGYKYSILNTGNSVVISEKLSGKYFGKQNPIGNILYINDSIPLTISGVFKELPLNTHFDFDVVISMKKIQKAADDLNLRFVGISYFKFKPGTDLNKFTARLNTKRKKEIEWSMWHGWKYGRANVFFQPLKKAPFKSYRYDQFQEKSKFTLKLLVIISLIILIIAWINYTNLSIAQNRKRLKEFSVRKTSGARN